MDKVMVDRVVTVVFFLLILTAAIALHLWNQKEWNHHCPPDRMTRLCVE